MSVVHSDCIQFQTYCKLSRVPVEVHTACLPWKSPSCRSRTFLQGITVLMGAPHVGKFPVMTQAKKKTVSHSADDIITAVKELVSGECVSEMIAGSLLAQGFNLDRSLQDPALAEVVAYSAMLTDRLLPALVSYR